VRHERAAQAEQRSAPRKGALGALGAAVSEDDAAKHPLFDDRPPPPQKCKRRPPRRGRSFTQLPDWVVCKLTEARVGGATWAVAHAIE